MFVKRNRQESTKYFLGDFELAQLKKFSLKCLTTAKNKKLANLILTFSVIFNDIKDYIWFHSQLAKGKLTLDMDTLNPKRGQLAGMQAHCMRMLIASFLEFLETISKNADTINSQGFKLVLHYLEKKFPGSNRHWYSLVKLAKGQQRFKDKFYNTLVMIRNNGTYHYHQIKSLYKGLEYYMQQKDDIGYVSLGDKLEEVRFYFGDAAIQYYHLKTVEENIHKFEQKLIEYIDDINVLLRFIIDIYITKVLAVRLQNVKSKE